jgi:hypothetical protein
MVTEEEHPQQQGKLRSLNTTCWCMAHQPSLPHTELEKEALGSMSRSCSVSGKTCFLEVISEDQEHNEGLQYLYTQLSRKMGTI